MSYKEETKISQMNAFCNVSDFKDAKQFLETVLKITNAKLNPHAPRKEINLQTKIEKERSNFELHLMMKQRAEDPSLKMNVRDNFPHFIFTTPTKSRPFPEWFHKQLHESVKRRQKQRFHNKRGLSLLRKCQLTNTKMYLEDLDKALDKKME